MAIPRFKECPKIRRNVQELVFSFDFMADHPLKLSLCPNLFFVAKGSPGSCTQDLKAVDNYQGEFFSLTQTADEISIVGQQTISNLQQVSTSCTVNPDWSMFRVCGTLDFEWVGILSRITGALSENSVPVFCLSTFDTDYVLVKHSRQEEAIKAFREN